MVPFLVPPHKLLALTKLAKGVPYKVPVLSASTTTLPAAPNILWVVASEFLKAPETSNLTDGEVLLTPTLVPLLNKTELDNQVLPL